MNKEEALSQRRWFVVDAQGKVLGRMASEIAKILRGKHKPAFTPNQDVGDFVVVVNARAVRLTGSKLQSKVYYRHTEYPGGIRERSAAQMLELKPAPRKPSEKPWWQRDWDDPIRRRDRELFA